ncbi:MAG: peptidylprolyl isomerase [Actinomycetota bacterium]
MPPPRHMTVRSAVALAAAVAALAAAGCGDDISTPQAATTATATSATPGCTDRVPEPVGERPTFDQPPPREIDVRKSYRATLVTSCGRIVIALDAKAAPNTVNNFVALARRHFYDGLTFHRVVTGFVIQGGDPNGDGTGGPGYEFPDELPPDGYRLGSVAMANSGPDTNGSQFFIVTGEQGTQLPPAYSRFGRVVAGMDVARTIEGFADPNAPPGDPAAQVPTRPVYIFQVLITAR